MKKIISCSKIVRSQFLIIVLFLGGVLHSCSKFLEVAPTNVVAMSSYDDVKAFVGSYLYGFNNSKHILQGTSSPLRNNDIKMMGQFYSDDLNTDRYLENYLGANNIGFLFNTIEWKDHSIASTVWREYYSNIGYFNAAIGELDKLKDVSLEDYELVASEMKFFRAWYLFKLMQYFSPYHHAELGLPINFDSDKVGEYNRSRKTQIECYDIILQELHEVLNYTTEPKPSFNIFYDKAIINALLAQIYLYKGGSGAGQETDYPFAIKHAQAAMKDKPLNGLDDYNPMRRAPNQTGSFKNYAEHLLFFTYSMAGGGLQLTIGSPAYGVASLMQYAREDLYKMFDDKDIRKKYFFNENRAILKFEHDRSLNLDMHALFPIAEMQLIIAESYARSGNKIEAKNAYEFFMKKRVRDYVYAGEDVLSSILDERRKEFCFEDDMRWMDLTRLQKGWSRKAIDKKGGGTYTIEDGDYRFCFPIPLNEELQHNKIQQNPGWGNL